MNQLKKEIIIYFISISVGLFLITYLLEIPHLVTGNREIVNKYYLENFSNNIPLDFFFIIIYFIIGNYIIDYLKITDAKNKLLTIGVTTALITGGFYIYFTNSPVTKNFFSIWFHTVGKTSIVYDVILLVFIYAIILWLKRKINKD